MSLSCLHQGCISSLSSGCLHHSQDQSQQGIHFKCQFPQTPTQRPTMRGFIVAIGIRQKSKDNIIINIGRSNYKCNKIIITSAPLCESFKPTTGQVGLKHYTHQPLLPISLG